MEHNVGTYDHIALYGIAAAGEEGVPKKALLSSNELIERYGFGNGPIVLLVEGGMSSAAAERTMRDPLSARKATEAFFAHVVETLIASKRIVEEDGVLYLGTMPRGYDPLKQDAKHSKSITRLNLVGARRKTEGWSNYTNPLDDNVVAQMAETMARKGWPKGHTVLLDSDGLIADGKHHVAAAELAGIDWKKYSKVVTDEIALWEEVESRNIDRWHGKPSEVAKIRASFIALRADLSTGERLEAIRQSFPNTSERTQRRVTAEVKKDVKAERDEAVADGLAAGKSQRQVAEEVGVDQKTVSNISARGKTANSAEIPHPEPEEEVGTCCICKHPILASEAIADIVIPEPGFRIGKPRRKSVGGARPIGPFEETGEVAHVDCVSREVQVGYRGVSV